MAESLLKSLIPNIEHNSLDDNIKYLSKIFPDLPNFNLIALLSAQYYEKHECKSKMVLLPNTGVPLPKLTPKYKTPVELSPKNIRQITKFLAAANRELALIMKCAPKTCSYKAIGMSIDEIEKDQFVYIVKFNGHMNYSFYISDHHLFDYENGSYKLPNSSEFADLKRSMQKFKIDEDKISIFVEHVKKIISAGHGTTMVLCSNACPCFYNEEIERLAKAGRAIKIKSVDLFSDDMMVDKFLCQTAVADGGFIINQNGECSAINVIFDGEIDARWKKYKGLKSRGSRYNALSAYIYGKNTSCHSCTSKNDSCSKHRKRAIAIIISDDGMYSLITEGEQLNET